MVYLRKGAYGVLSMGENTTQPMDIPKKQHALVIGGSMAGLLAARVLADHFAQVTVVDRDRFPETPGPRKGVPQARHIHVLLVRGLRILEHLFPGLQADLLAQGAQRMDLIGDVEWFGLAGWAQRFPSKIII